MFKAISRWGSQVRSSIGIGFISNLFGSKSKQKYGEFNDETEEIFSDAHEELDTDHDSDNASVSSNKQTEVVIETVAGPVTSTASLCDTNGENKDRKSDVVNNGEALDTTFEDNIGVSSKDKDTSSTNGDCRDTADGNSLEVSGQENNSTGANVCDINTECDTSDDKKEHNSERESDSLKPDETAKSSSDQNGMTHSSSSSSVFQKVHRRINSYSQRQYAKFDNIQDDENDNKITVEDHHDNDEKTSHSDHDDVDNLVTPKKKSKKKKVPLFSYIRGLFRRKNT